MLKIPSTTKSTPESTVRVIAKGAIREKHRRNPPSKIPPIEANQASSIFLIFN